MQRGVTLVAHQQAAVAVQPGKITLYHPAVAPEPLARLDPAAGDPWGDAAAAAGRAIAARSVAPVRVQLGGPPARAAGAAAGLLERRDGIDQTLQHGALVSRGPRAEHRPRGAPSLGHPMVLRPRVGPV